MTVLNNYFCRLICDYRFMKLLQIKFSVFLLLFSFFTANAQIQALFNNKTQLRNMTERWELDTTAVRGTLLVTP